MAAEYLDGVYLGSSDKNLTQTRYEALKTDSRFDEIDTAPILAAGSSYTFRFPFPDEDETSIGNYGSDEDTRGIIFGVPESVFQLSSHNSLLATYNKTQEEFSTTCPDLTPATDAQVTFEITQQEFVNDGSNDVLATVLRCWHCEVKETITEAQAQAIYDHLYPQAEAMLKEQVSELSEDTKEALEYNMSVLDLMLAGYNYSV